jgi:DNA ligase-1
VATRLDDLVHTSAAVAATRARSEKTGRLAELLRRLEPEEIEIATAFLSGLPRQGRIGLGPAAVREALHGERSPTATLSLLDVDRAFDLVVGVAGKGSTRERSRLLGELFRRATAEEAELLARLILGELRQGALEGLLVEAVAQAGALPLADVRRAHMLSGDLPVVARAALGQGAAGLAAFRLEPFRALQPMLAQPADDLESALERLGRAVLEYKLDGARVQVHRAGDEVRAFSRRMNDVTAAVPELVERVRALPVRQAVLDGEVLALRPDGSPLPFQDTMRRFGRRLDVERLRAELPLSTFFFDLLHLDGRDLIDQPAHERFAALDAVAGELVVPRIVTAEPAEADAFYDRAIARGHEGLMAKAPGAPYEAGGRGFSWLKIKPSHTLDLVVLAVEWGNGRRTGWLSNIHLGARDAATGAFVMLGKTFKGMTDEILAWQTKHFQSIAVATDGYTVHVRPETVAEIALSDVQQSPHYPAGMALRFARLVRYRLDKSAAEADTLDAVRAIFLRGRPGG